MDGQQLMSATTRPQDRDAGITLLEVMVGMAIMSVFMVMFTTGVIQIYRTTNRIESTSIAQTQINQAIARLDKEIRYAAAISTPGCAEDIPSPCAAGHRYRYVEYLTTNTGVATCAQLRMDLTAGTLKRRTWPQDTEPLGASLPSWDSLPPLVSDVTATEPFAAAPPEPGVNFQRLRLRLSSTWGTGETATTKQTDITFTALNSTASSESTTVCTEGRRFS
jgi:prepilin-type N-terminal cleavage/methylation domain-containing protein